MSSYSPVVSGSPQIQADPISASSTSAITSLSGGSIAQQEEVAESNARTGESIIHRESNVSLSRLIPLEEIADKRCWICFGEEDDSTGKWVRPCKCSLICHEECLLNWIAETQKGTALKKVRCPQCKTPYQLNETKSLILQLLSIIDATIQSSIPYVTVLGVTFGVAITQFHYGAYALLTVVGLEEGGRILRGPWSWRMILNLPLIPAFLICSRIPSLNNYMLLSPILYLKWNQLRISLPPHPTVTLAILPTASYVYNRLYFQLFGKMEVSWQTQVEPYAVATIDGGNGDNANERARNDRDLINRVERRDYGRLIVGALCLPFLSAAFGSLLGRFNVVKSRIPDHFHRSIIGGCLLIVFKDAVNLTLKYQKAKNRRSRHVRNYDEFAREFEPRGRRA